MNHKLDKGTWVRLKLMYNQIILTRIQIIQNDKKPNFDINVYKKQIQEYAKEAVEILSEYDQQDNYVCILQEDFELLIQDQNNLYVINDLDKMFGEYSPY